MARVADQAIKIAKLDSHMHLHLPPGFFQAVVEVGRKHRVEGIRLPREEFRWRGLACIVGSAKQVVLRCLALLQAGHVRSAELFCPDQLCGIAESGQMTEKARLRALSSLRPGVTEITLHSGSHDGELRAWPVSPDYRREKAHIALSASQIK